MKYDVMRQHIGGKFYMPGDIREAEERDVAHLVKKGVLSPSRKAEPALQNKAEPKLDNKADQDSANKRDPLDHDGDGKKGGSLPKSERDLKA